MIDSIRKNLTLLTLISVLAGAVISNLFRDKVSHSPRPWSQQELLREIDLGANMPVVAFSQPLTSRFAKGSPPSKDLSQPVLVDSTGATKLFVPDRYALAAIACGASEPEFKRMNREYGGIRFQGELAGRPKYARSVDDSLPPGQWRTGVISFQGSVYACSDGRETLVASGVELQAPIEQVGEDGIQIKASSGWVAYPGFVGDFYIAFLLMIFVPTLTLSVMKAIVDSAQTISGTAQLFRYTLKYFAASTTIAAGIGIVSGYCCYLTGGLGPDLNQLAATSLAGKAIPAEYDPHPILTQLSNIVPLNPLGALTSPDGNKGLQVAFAAIMIGLLLGVVGPARRSKISGFLKQALALVVRDNDLQWNSLSDWADVFTPFGVFFVSLTFCATLSKDVLGHILNVILIIFAALAAHAAVLLTWIFWKRNWREWLHDGLVPGTAGLMTALATSSSYAALPAITAVPFLSNKSSRRGIFDLSTTLNKNGTTIYIATFASYLLFDRLNGSMHSLVIVVLMVSALASVATAGLPFAAVFGLRMVLLATSLPAGLAWLIVPIDPLVDRFVTVVNVFANLAACSEKANLCHETPSLHDEAVTSSRQSFPSRVAG